MEQSNFFMGKTIAIETFALEQLDDCKKMSLT